MIIKEANTKFEYELEVVLAAFMAQENAVLPEDVDETLNNENVIWEYDEASDEWSWRTH